MRSLYAALPFALLCTAELGAQTLTQGSTRFAFTGTPTGCNSVAGLNDFTATAQDTLYQHFWALCLDNDTVACRLYGPTSIAIPASGYGNAGVNRYANWQARSVDVSESVAVHQLSPGVGIAVSRFRLTNLSGAPVRLNLYSYADFDMYGTQNSAQGLSTPVARYHRITNASSVTDFVEHFGYGADGDAVLPFATLRAAILAGCPDYATSPFSPGGQFGPGDYTGAFQWKDRMIPSGTSFEAWVGFAHNVSVRTCPAALATAYGAASGSGTGLLLGTSPVLGNLLSYEILAGTSAANQACAVFFGLNQISLPVSGLTILNTLDLFSVSLTLDANGVGIGYLPVPYLPAVCGAAMHAQAIYIDPASPIGIPVSATQGLTYTVGS